MDDQNLLSQYVATGDASSFAELTRRYSPLVRGVCFRMLGNSHDAEEVTQECFFELARHAGDIHTSLAGWLQRAAKSRALNAIRSRIRRKNRERTFGLEREANPNSAVEYGEPDLHRLIQGALKEHPENLRLPMVLHYVDGQSQRDVAVKLGLNQSTISRRMRDALRQLRDKLVKAGYAATAPAVMVLMREHGSTITTEIGGSEFETTASIEKVVGSTTLISSLVKGIATASLPIFSFLLFDGWVSLFTAIIVTICVARFRPIWVSEIMASFGVPDLYRQQTFFLDRWNWSTPPEGWQKQVRTSLVWSSLFAGFTLTFAFGTQQPPWGIIVFGMAATTVCFIHAFRLWRRAARTFTLPTTPSLVNPSSPDSQEGWLTYDGTWTDATQLISIGLLGTGITIPAVLQRDPGIVWPAVTLCATLSAAMIISGVQLCCRLMRPHRPQANDESPIPETDVVSAGTMMIVTIGTLIVAALSGWILWNRTTVPNSALSLAAVQTSMLGWTVYRIATFQRSGSPFLVRRLVIAILVGCFVLNSGISLANWLN